MPDPSLASLEQLRRAAVEQAQGALAEARAELARRETLLHEASSQKQRCDEELQAARAQFGGGRGMRALRLCEERIRALALDRQAALQRLASAQVAHRGALAHVEERLQALVQAEAGRRAVQHLIERGLQAATKQREQSEEEEAEAAWPLRARDPAG